MKVKTQHLQLAGALVVASIAFSAWRIMSPTARPQQQGPAYPDQQQSMQMGRAGGPGQVGGMVAQAPVTTDPTKIAAPPSIGAASLSYATRDPFLFSSESREVREAPVVAQAEEPPPDPELPVVKSVMISTSRRVALIENKALTLGEKIGELTIVQIERDGVTFLLPNGTRKKATMVSTQGATGGVIR